MRAGIVHADGDLIMIQDADLEYEPDDYIPMLDELIRIRRRCGLWQPLHAAAGIGNACGQAPGQSWAAYLGGRSLSLVQWWFTGQYLTDTVTALKLFRAPVIKGLELRTNGFELDHEITSRILGAGLHASAKCRSAITRATERRARRSAPATGSSPSGPTRATRAASPSGRGSKPDRTLTSRSARGPRCRTRQSRRPPTCGGPDPAKSQRTARGSPASRPGAAAAPTAGSG